jgi:hypothetical protein
MLCLALAMIMMCSMITVMPSQAKGKTTVYNFYASKGMMVKNGNKLKVTLQEDYGFLKGNYSKNKGVVEGLKQTDITKKTFTLSKKCKFTNSDVTKKMSNVGSKTTYKAMKESLLDARENGWEFSISIYVKNGKVFRVTAISS